MLSKRPSLTLIQRQVRDDALLSTAVALSFAGILLVNLIVGFSAELKAVSAGVSVAVKLLVALGFVAAVPAALRRDLTSKLFINFCHISF